MSPLRKRLNTIGGVLLLGGIWYLIHPFWTGAERMRGFCSSLPIVTSMDNLRRLTADRGFDLALGVDQHGYIHEKRSMGRFLCEIQLRGNRLESAAYQNND